MTYLTVRWRDEVTGRPGYLVIDRLERGVASGGLRMRDGLTVDEVGDLARAMTLKEGIAYEPGLAYRPLGGAKGGIDFDPLHPEAEGVLHRYVEAMRPLLATRWATGEDLGLRQAQIDAACRAAGMRTSIDAALPLTRDPDAALAAITAAQAVRVDGQDLADLVGGCGVAESALVALERSGVPVAGARAVVQGFGSMGGATARYLAAAGVRVVGIADADGLAVNDDGLDVEKLLAGRDGHGRFDRADLRPADRELPRDAWLDVDCDVLIPAAVSYAIGAADAPRVRARLIAEAANAPVTPEAEAALTGRGVTVIPDVVANTGTNAWWWWTLFGDVPPEADAALTRVRTWMRRVTTEILNAAGRSGRTPRAEAHALSARNRAAMTG